MKLPRSANDRWRRLSSAWRGRVELSDETKVRIAAAVLWALVALAALSGVAALFRSPSATRSSTASGSVQELTAAWAASGFGARFVGAYLTATAGDQLAEFLGYAPDLGIVEVSGDRDEAVDVHVVGADRVGEGYWAVTVAAGAPGGEQFWRVGIVQEDGRMVATGLPSPADVPTTFDGGELAVGLSDLPVEDDPAAETVAGFVAAYVCGQGELDRYLAPSVELSTVSPPLCNSSRLDRWGIEPVADDRLQVVVEATLANEPSGPVHRVTFALLLSRRDGRWEVAELQPAPPLAEPGSAEDEEGSR